MNRKAEKIFSWFILLIFCALFLMTWHYGAKARTVPLLLLVPGILLTVYYLWHIHHKPEVEEKSIVEDGQENFEIDAPFDQEMWMIGWFVAFTAMIWFAGFLIATPLFLLLFLRFWAKERWPLTLMLAGFSTLIMYLIVEVGFRIILYRGWLFSF
jgi:hypothetical protein